MAKSLNVRVVIGLVYVPEAVYDRALQQQSPSHPPDRVHVPPNPFLVLSPFLGDKGSWQKARPGPQISNPASLNPKPLNLKSL